MPKAGRVPRHIHTHTHTHTHPHTKRDSTACSTRPHLSALLEEIAELVFIQGLAPVQVWLEFPLHEPNSQVAHIRAVL